jgi:hypothetical protein
MQDLTQYMDPFFGNGTIDLPEPDGIAATWFFIKAQTGNTYPGACAPFGMLSACAYSGAYPTGYGLNAPNYNSTPPQRFDRLVASGFTHLQQSGTGAIETYYNYLRVTPLTGGLDQLGTRWDLEDETASPGYYAATLAGTGIRAELTASPRAALHRYTFPETHVARLATDFGIGGIDFPRMRTYPTEAEIALTTPNAAQGHIVMAGMTLYVYLETDMADASSALWMEGQKLGDRRCLTLTDITEANYQPFGCVFSREAGGRAVVHVCVGFSLRRHRGTAGGLLLVAVSQPGQARRLGRRKPILGRRALLRRLCDHVGPVQDATAPDHDAVPGTRARHREHPDLAGRARGRLSERLCAQRRPAPV